MLHAVPKRWFSWDFNVMRGDEVLGDIDMSLWREQGVLTVGGEAYRVYREGLMNGDFVLESSGVVLARAQKPSAWRRSFTITHAGRTYTLRAASLFRRAFTLFEGETEIGRVSPQGILSRRAEVDLPDAWPLPLKIFIVWLAVLLWKRDSDSSAAGAAN